MIAMLFCISIASYIQSHIPEVMKYDHLKDIAKPDPLAWVCNAEVRDFWSKQEFRDVFTLPSIPHLIAGDFYKL
jgi:hypothetical protein